MPGSFRGDVPCGRDMKELSRNQFAITEAAAVGRDDRSALRCHLRVRYAGARRGFGIEELPHLSGGILDGGAASCTEWLPAV